VEDDHEDETIVDEHQGNSTVPIYKRLISWPNSSYLHLLVTDYHKFSLISSHSSDLVPTSVG
jgi:hypothetical protein